MTIRKTTRRPSMNTAPQALTDDQLRRILDLSTKEPTLRDLHEVATIISSTWIRPGELTRLRWTDVDILRRTLIVNSTNSKSGCMRLLPCEPKTLEILATRREREPDAEHVLGGSPRELLRSVSDQLSTVCAGIGVHGVTLHLLRRTLLERPALAGASLDS